MARYEGLDVLVMQVKPYRETSALVTVFSKQQGRFTLLMRGVRNRKSNLLVQPFVIARVSCFGKGSLLTSTKYDLVAQFELSGNSLSAGFYLLEVLRRSMVEYQAEPQVFDLAVQTLQQLKRIQTPDSRQIAQCLRPFDFNLLKLLGFGLDFEHDAQSGESVVAEKQYHLVPEVGFVSTDSTPQAEDAHLYSGQQLLAISRWALRSNEDLQAAGRISQALLPALIGHEPIVSRSLWST